MLNRSRRRRLVLSLALLLAGLSATAFGQRREDEDEARRGPGLAAEARRASRPGAPPASCDRQRRALDLSAGRHIVQLDILDEIDLGLATHVERVVAAANQDPTVALILVHMNTPGGRVDAAEMIKDSLLRSKAPTATFIDTAAFSAGALIAYATDIIIVSPGASMGAATPILIGESGDVKDAGEKMVSALRSMFRATAEAKGRNPLIAEAMVDKDVDVPGLKPDGKLVTLTRAELLTWCVADLAADHEEGALTALGAQALPIERQRMTWAESIARFLTSTAIASMLMSLGMLGLMVELYTPGFGAAGLLSLTCFILYFGGHLVVHLAGVEEILLFAVGLGLVAFELLAPGHIIPGVLGTLAILGALILAMLGRDLTIAWSSGGVSDALFRTSMSLVGSIVVFAVLARFLPKSRLMGRLVHTGALAGTAHESPASGTSVSVGAEAVTVTPVLGSGKARLADGAVIDVVAEAGALEAGQAVVVVSSRPGRVVVAARGPA